MSGDALGTAALGEDTRREVAQSRSLGRLAVRGSVLELLGYAASQILRLSSNLILSRLLFPEAFGLAALVATMQQGLVMLSDMGIEAGIVQSRHGDEPRYFNTAWTLQVLRGIVLWLIAALLAWPAAILYEEPLLGWLVPVGSLNVLILGFAGTSLATLRRRLALGTLLVIEFTGQVLALVVIATWAYISPSPWPLVVGGLAAALTRVIASHSLSIGYKNRFEWNADALSKLVGFGKWIFASSALLFLSKQADRLLIGKLVGAATLGIYSMAVLLSEAVTLALAKISHRVFFPFFSRIAHESKQELQRMYYRARFYTDALCLTAIGGLTATGQVLVDVLYDDRYAEAGWMIRVLSIRAALTCIASPCEIFLMSIGQTRYGFFHNACRALWVVVAMPLGWAWWGMKGIVWSAALSEIPALMILWTAFARHGTLRIHRELLGACFYVVGLVLGDLLLHGLRTLAWI